VISGQLEGLAFSAAQPTATCPLVFVGAALQAVLLIVHLII